MSHFLILDCETGGLDWNVNPILSLYAELIRPDFTVVDSVEILINSSGATVNSKALEVNGIDLEFHNQIAQSREEAGVILKQFMTGCSRWALGSSLSIVGQYIDFDLNFVNQLIPDFREKHARSSIDIRMLSTWLIGQGLLHSKNASLQSVRQALSIELDADAHTHRGDVAVTKEVFRLYTEALRKGFAQ